MRFPDCVNELFDEHTHLHQSNPILQRDFGKPGKLRMIAQAE
jgi:hypothetical protein